MHVSGRRGAVGAARVGGLQLERGRPATSWPAREPALALQSTHRSCRPRTEPALGHVGWPGVVDQPLGERTRQHQLALGHRDEGVAQPVAPEAGAAGLGDSGLELQQLRDVARRRFPRLYKFRNLWHSSKQEEGPCASTMSATASGGYRLAQFGHRWALTPNDAHHRFNMLQFCARYGPAATVRPWG